MALRICGWCRPLTWVFGSYLATFARNRTLMAFEALKLVLLLGCIAAFARFGPLWSAGAVGIAFATHAVVMATLTFTAIAFVALNTLVDVLYTVLDPRVRISS